jgi:hypothetical protein
MRKYEKYERTSYAVVAAALWEWKTMHYGPVITHTYTTILISANALDQNPMHVLRRTVKSENTKNTSQNDIQL